MSLVVTFVAYRILGAPIKFSPSKLLIEFCNQNLLSKRLIYLVRAGFESWTESWLEPWIPAEFNDWEPQGGERLILCFLDSEIDGKILVASGHLFKHDESSNDDDED